MIDIDEAQRLADAYYNQDVPDTKHECRLTTFMFNHWDEILSELRELRAKCDRKKQLTDGLVDACLRLTAERDEALSALRELREEKAMLTRRCETLSLNLDACENMRLRQGG